MDVIEDFVLLCVNVAYGDIVSGVVGMPRQYLMRQEL